jgi:hypothetical protein
MKASKFIVLVGGILGLIAFFLPAVNVTTERGKVGVSAMQLVAGLDLAKSAVDEAAVTPDTADAAAFSKARGDTSAEISKIKGFVLALFAPALLLVLLGGVGAMRRKFGRGFGAMSLLLGLISLALGALIMSVASEGGSETGAGIAITLLVVTGIAGAIGGLLALVKPDRGLATA